MAYRNALLLFKKPVGWFVGGALWGNTRAHGKKFQAGFNAASIFAVEGTNIVTVCFNEPPVATNYATGVTIEVNSVARNITITAVDKTCVDYTIDGAALVQGDLVTWTYDADAVGADYTGGNSGEALEDSSLNFNLPSPPVTTDAWATETTPGRWKTESGDDWILESSAAIFITFMGLLVTFNGLPVTYA